MLYYREFGWINSQIDIIVNAATPCLYSYSVWSPCMTLDFILENDFVVHVGN